jgi:hypothetical protein
MLEVGDKFDVVYAGNKKLTCVCLAGRKFAKLMLVLQRLQNASDTVEADLFDESIPEALSLILGDKEQAEDLWENKITLRDAIEILSQAVQGHIIADGDLGK